MEVLALETATQPGSVAWRKDGQLRFEVQLPEAPRTAATLAPAIVRLREDRGLNLSRLDLIATTASSGSFTGLRLGVTLAKTLAFALRIPVIGVDTLAALASAVPGEEPVAAALPAGRGQWCAAIYRKSNGRLLDAAVESWLVDPQEWLAGLDPQTWLTGPVLTKEIPPTAAQCVDPSLWRPRAQWVGQLAATLYAGGAACDLETLSPRYARPSYAEE